MQIEFRNFYLFLRRINLFEKKLTNIFRVNDLEKKERGGRETRFFHLVTSFSFF